MAKKRSHPQESSKGKKKSDKEKPEKKAKPSPKQEKKDVPADGSSQDNPSTWSKSKKKRMRMLKGKLQKKETVGNPTESLGGQESDKPVVTEELTEKGHKNSKLQNAFKARLSGSRFRILNEELYTTTSKESFDRFSQNPELFEQYHDGFRHQVESWPVNPVDVIVRWLSSNYHKKSCVVADFGCGDAQLAKDLLKVQEKNKSEFKVHSFDLVSQNEWVTAADMSNVPLKDKSVDVCIFCLSLMGTNLADFIREAHRVLKEDGRIKIAEVRSRIEYSHSKKGKNNSNKEPGAPKKSKGRNAGTLEEFTDVLKDLGFDCVKTDKSNKMFLVMELKKNGKKPNYKLEFTAKPCIYKIR